MILLDSLKFQLDLRARGPGLLIAKGLGISELTRVINRSEHASPPPHPTVPRTRVPHAAAAFSSRPISTSRTARRADGEGEGEGEAEAAPREPPPWAS